MTLVLVGDVTSFVIGDPPVDVSGKFATAAAKRMLTRFADAGDGSPQFSAVASICTHRGCPILKGDPNWGTTNKPIYDSASRVITCPCHMSQFNVATGAVVKGPAQFPLATFAVQVQATGVYVDSDPMPAAGG